MRKSVRLAAGCGFVNKAIALKEVPGQPAVKPVWLYNLSYE
jgi:hypothetical protein